MNKYKKMDEPLISFQPKNISRIKRGLLFLSMGVPIILNACNFQNQATGTGMLKIDSGETSVPLAVSQNFLYSIAQVDTDASSGEEKVKVSFLFYNDVENSEITNINSLSASGDFLYISLVFSSISAIGPGYAQINNESESTGADAVIVLSLSTDEGLSAVSGTFEDVARAGEVEFYDISIDSTGYLTYVDGWYSAEFGSGDSWFEGSFTIANE
jgi:hypothetical protein